jgi:hypothetical protein
MRLADREVKLIEAVGIPSFAAAPEGPDICPWLSARALTAEDEYRQTLGSLSGLPRQTRQD